MQDQKHLFNLEEGISYLNCAYMSPQLKAQTEIGIQRFELMERPYNIFTNDFFEPIEKLKTTFARLVNVKDSKRIAFIPSASYGLANAAQNAPLNPGDEILMLEEQFPSNVYTWQRWAAEKGATLKFIPAPDGVERSISWNEEILQAITERTAVVAIGTIHWADGTLLDLHRIRSKTKEVGALFILDGTQSVGAMPIDIEALQPDALICAGYKWLLCPYSTGFAYYGPAFDNGVPIEENWINRKNSEDFKNLVNYQPTYKANAHRYMMGEQSNFHLSPLVQVALDQLLAWKPSNIQDYCENLFAGYLDEFRDLGCSIEPDSNRCKHLFGIRLNEHLDANALNESFKQNKVFVSLRGSAIRFAPHLFNVEEDVQKILKCFKASRVKQIY